MSGLDSLPTPEPGAKLDPELVALAAQRTVLDTLYREGLPQTKAALAELADSLRDARVRQGVSATMRDRSVEYGNRLGLGILDWARRDGFDSTRALKWVAQAGRQY